MHRYLILIPLLLLLATVLTACGADSTLVPEMPTSTPAPTKIPTPIPTITATSAPTPVLISQTREWGIVKSPGAEVKEQPSASAKSVERLAGFTLVAWQNKLRDESWFERVGGGWINKNDATIYPNEAEARKALP